MDCNTPPLLPLGQTGIQVSRLGFGAFKLGRNQGIKYPSSYDLPTLEESTKLLNAIVDLGINLIDTAPAYGLSEERVGAALTARRDEIVLCTKVGETFQDGQSTFDFSSTGIIASVERSLQRLQTDRIDVLLLHSNGQDLEILNTPETVPTLQRLRDRGLVRAIGMSGKTVGGASHALSWADVLMVEYHVEDTSHDEVMRAAHDRGIGVIIKKALASGHLPAGEAIAFASAHPAVSSIVVGSLNLSHIAANLADAARTWTRMTGPR